MAGKYKVPRGTFDILPTESYKWQFITEKFRQVTKLFNYREIVTPIFESSEIFERSVGEDSDIVEKEMYKFEDKKGRSLALRPEGTAPVVRSFIENGLNLQPNASKLYYLGPMFRYDRPQKGRYRQFYQYGVENISSNDPFVDSEVISLAYLFLKNLGIADFELQINSIGCSNCTKDYDAVLNRYFTPFLSDLCSDCRKRLVKNPKRVLDCKVKTCKKIAAKAPSMLDYLDKNCNEHFSQVQDNLKLMDIPFVINPKIVRGLDYYSQTAFEFVVTSLGAQNTLIGGGRYDGLSEQLGGKQMPGVGFAGGFERLIQSMENEKLSFGGEQIPSIYLVALGNKARVYSLKLLMELRRNGISVDIDFDKISMNSQMKAANRSKADFALILGAEELTTQSIICKDLKNGEQEKINLKEVVNYLRIR
ncbi:MAG: histidine--tRNA ligase [Candidatus Cloacimonetes bacterium]|nr:histidine--tRNA ligase [Candidatus Cloacimonadota bacterium]